MNALTYQGHTARIEFDDRDNTLVGRLLEIKDIVGFPLGHFQFADQMGVVADEF